MPAEKSRQPLFYGWVIVAAGAVLSTVTGIMFSGFSTYLGPLGKEFGWSRTALAGPRSLTQAEGALLGPINGYFIDRFGAKKTMRFGILVLGVGLVLFGLMHELWQYFAVNVLIGVGTSFAGTFALYATLNNWFRRKRTTAISITQQGIGIAGLIAVPALVFIQAQFGWRAAAIGSGIFIWIVGFAATSFLKTSPESIGQLPDEDLPGAGPVLRTAKAVKPDLQPTDLTLKQAMQTRFFWFLAAANGLVGVVGSTIIVHQFLHMEQGVGLSRATAAGAFALLNVLTLVGRVAGGYLGDRHSKRKLLGGVMLLNGLSVIPLALAHSLAPVLLYSAIYGFCWGARTPIQFSILGDYVGRANFGKISGMLQAFGVPLSILGPVAGGALADWQGNYVMAFLILAGLSALAATVYFLVGRQSQQRRRWQGLCRGSNRTR